MCGDLEPENRFESDLLQRFLVHERALRERPLAADELHRYLDAMYRELLQRCAADAAQADAQAGGEGYRRLAMQSLVLARLAGFLAGHVALNEDPLRKLLEATMLGYQEAESAPARDHHHHGDDGHAEAHRHGHDHGHGHGHGHDH